MQMPGCHEIVQDGESCEEFDVLEGSPNAQTCNLVRGEVVNVVIFKDHLPLLRPIKSVNAIEDACFSSPVGTNDCKHLSLSDIETDA
jgi:hypothetical protein